MFNPMNKTLFLNEIFEFNKENKYDKVNIDVSDKYNNRKLYIHHMTVDDVYDSSTNGEDEETSDNEIEISENVMKILDDENDDNINIGTMTYKKK
jgi:hypothetical protein